MKKRILNGLLLTTIITVFALVFGLNMITHGSSNSKVVYNQLDYQATMTESGNLHITQTIDVSLKEGSKPYHQIYQRYNLNSLNLTNITNITVQDLNTGEVYHQSDAVSPSEIKRYSDSEWDNEKAGSWYLATVGHNDSLTDWDSELQVQKPESTDPAAMLGATVDEDGETIQTGDSQLVELGWNIPVTTSMDNGKFKIDMTWDNVTTSYSDSSGFQWEPIGVDNTTLIKQLNGSITLPESMTVEDGTLKSWMHYTGNGQVNLNNNIITFNATNITPGSYVDLIVLGKGNAINAKRRVDKPAFDVIMDYESEMESKWVSEARSNATRKIVLWVLIIVITVILVILCARSAVKAKRGMTYNGEIEYWREPPELSPALAAVLYNMTSWSNNDSSGLIEQNALTATMMSLMEKGYITVYPGGVDTFSARTDSQGRYVNMYPSGVDLHQTVNFSNDDEMITHMEFDTERSHKDQKKSKNNLTIVLHDVSIIDIDSPLSNTERTLLHTIKTTASVLNTKTFDFEMIKQVIRKRNEFGNKPTHEAKQLIIAWRDAKVSMTESEISSSTEWRNQKLIEPIGKFSAGWFWVLGIFAFIVGIESNSPAVVCCYSIPIIALSVFTFEFIGNFKRLTSRGQKMAGEVQGLARYLLDFSDFKDRDVIDVVLWGEYLVYATAFGIAPKVIDQLKQAQVNTDVKRDYYDYNHRSNHHYGRNGSNSLFYWSTATDSAGLNGWDLGSSINDAISDVQSTIRSVTAKSSGGSGGSSFGGSSGGSGGGSFGAR